MAELVCTVTQLSLSEILPSVLWVLGTIDIIDIVSLNRIDILNNKPANGKLYVNSLTFSAIVQSDRYLLRIC